MTAKATCATSSRPPGGAMRHQPVVRVRHRLSEDRLDHPRRRAHRSERVPPTRLREPAPTAFWYGPLSRHQHRQHQGQPDRSARACSARLDEQEAQNGCTSCERRASRPRHPGPAVRGYGRSPRRGSCCSRSPTTSERATYLRRIWRARQHARRTRPSAAIQVAFTAQGLARLGVPTARCATFSREFLEGMDETFARSRSAIAADSEPSTLAVGTGSQPVTCS